MTLNLNRKLAKGLEQEGPLGKSRGKIRREILEFNTWYVFEESSKISRKVKNIVSIKHNLTEDI